MLLSRLRALSHRNSISIWRKLPLPVSRTMSVQQPHWEGPKAQSSEPVLKLYNSLTKSKETFVPETGRHVKWYNCGPTVYDSSHMGHARNYVTQDILRRIMTDYFGYDVHFVMNITDIDDKIIIRARQQHLVDKVKSETSALSQALFDQVKEAWIAYFRSQFTGGLAPGDIPPEGQEYELWSRILELSQDNNWKAEGVKRDEKFDMHLKALSKTDIALRSAQSLLAVGGDSREEALKLIVDSQDVLARYLDKKYGHTVTDPTYARDLAAYWEDQFFKDMDRLRVRRPDTLTRVTEYLPEIVAFVKQVVDNGYGYALDGSVYFDTGAFDGVKGHAYAKLQPWSKGNRKLLEEGEGASSSIAGGRKSPSDFAMWKASKPGEPSWPSPWGPGRPGWHIECSVMATAVFGDNMDIHSGGIDLAFPHHDNELAQSEAYHDCGQWVNYFLHTGHLHIEGLKMSKSLKNFITIEEILEKFTPRQLRLAFLSQLWSSKVDFTDSLMTGEVREIENTFNNLFTNVKAIISSYGNASKKDGNHNYGDVERGLQQFYRDAQSAFRAALCDSFNTPLALETLLKLVSRTNVYINARGNAVNVNLLEGITTWIGAMLRMFGLGEDERVDLGWGERRQSSGDVNRDEILMPYLRAFSSFRDEVRSLAIAKEENMGPKILNMCDQLRDVDLVQLGVALDDQEDGKALVKLVEPAQLIKAREEKKAAAEAKAARKLAAVEAERQKRLQKLEKGRVPPTDMFKPPHVPEGTYGSWDESGLPLTDGSGEPISKSANKRIQKEFAAQQKAHAEFLEWQKTQS